MQIESTAAQSIDKLAALLLPTAREKVLLYEFSFHLPDEC